MTVQARIPTPQFEEAWHELASRSDSEADPEAPPQVLGRRLAPLPGYSRLSLLTVN